MAVVAVGAVVLLGVALRLDDPLSSSVVPAEDPYTHMALVREHLRTGDLQPLNPGQDLYPPGLHAFLAAAWAFTGTDLYDLVLYGPVAFGAIGLLGLAALLWRGAGPVASLVGTLAFAIAPEAVFRSAMMSPTALDLAILPALLYALLRVTAGRLGWALVAAPLSVFLGFSHPWLLAILCAAGAAFLLASLALPWPAKAGAPLRLRSVAACLSVLGLGLGVALLMPSFAGTLGLPGRDLAGLWIALAVAAQVPLALALLRPGSSWPSRTVGRPDVPRATVVRFAVAIGLALAVVLVAATARQGGLPPLVDLPRMLGWPTLALAFAGAVALPFLASPLSHLAASLAAVTLPFVLFDPLDSDFLAHRTVIYLGLALALLAGVAAAAAARAAAAAWTSRRPASSPAAAPSGPAPARRGTWLHAVGPALLVATLLGGSVYAYTPDTYPGGWYRLYTPCELDALREVAKQADADPALVIITGDWQSKLVLAALTQDASRVWYTRDVYTSETARDRQVAGLAQEGRPVMLLVDRHLRTETPDADPSFLASPPWQPAGAWCNLGMATPRLTAYVAPVSPGGAR